MNHYHKEIVIALENLLIIAKDKLEEDKYDPDDETLKESIKKIQSYKDNFLKEVEENPLSPLAKALKKSLEKRKTS